MNNRELTYSERCRWGECPVCHARDGEDCNPSLGNYGVHFGRIKHAPQFNVTMALAEFFDQEIEPEAKCRNCEYFNGGGLTAEGKTVHDHGDCGNRASPYFTTSGSNTCKHFFPCSTRWPDADHG